jgi:acetyl-CoA C-acetyltransferase
MSHIYLVLGWRTPFVKASGVFAKHNALELSVPVVKAMAERARPDFLSPGVR